MTDVKNMETIDIETGVVVIGGGPTGIKAALETADMGYPVTVCDKSAFETDGRNLPHGNAMKCASDAITTLYEKAKAHKNITLKANANVSCVCGVAGDFTVKFAGEKENAVKAGAIVVASDCGVKPLNAAYGVELSGTILSQSDMEARIEKEAAGFTGKTICFLMGFGQIGNPIVFERVLKSVKKIQDAGKSTIYVMVGDLKVALDGLDRLYKETRDNGAIFFKMHDAPKVTAGDKTKVQFKDPVILRDVEIAADYLVVEEAILPDTANEALAGLMRISFGTDGYLQPDNFHFFPVRSNREGIYLVGPSRDVVTLPAAFTDAENVALEIKSFLKDGKVTVPADKAEVDRGKCVICLTCYRACPHGAIYWDERAIISKVACQACGICSSECPMDAIQIGACTDDALTAAIKEAASTPAEGVKILAFCCENSAYEAAEMAKSFGMALPAGLKLIKTPCAGKMDTQSIMLALAEGADGVLVMTCHNGNCKSEKGNVFAGFRVNDAKRMLEEAGIEKERVKKISIASNMGKSFADEVLKMEAEIKALG